MPILLDSNYSANVIIMITNVWLVEFDSNAT